MRTEPSVKVHVVIQLAELQHRLQQLSATATTVWGVVPSGFAPLDEVLPGRGFRRGTLVEWLATEPGAGATHAALHAAKSAMSDERPLVIVDSHETFHPPGLGEMIDWRQVLLVRCRSTAEVDWAADLALRASGVGAVLLRFDQDNERQLRRLQLAAEHSGALGLVVRQLTRQPEACFSDVRLQVTPSYAAEGRCIQLQVLRSRQGGIGAVVQVRLDDNAHPLPAPAAARSTRQATGT